MKKRILSFFLAIISTFFTMMSILLHVIVEVVSFSFYKLLNSGRGEN